MKNENILILLRNVAITSGNRVLEFYEFDTEITYKNDEPSLTKADIDTRFRLTFEWNIASAYIILLEVGGKLKSIDNKDLVYNKKKIFLTHFFAYANDALL